MAFVNGVWYINAEGAALNNAGAVAGARTDNMVAVKKIRTPEGEYPYVSAQAVRFWLRRTLERSEASSWKSAPIYRDKKIAYTDANPLEWDDDDVFGYMRAEAKEKEAKTAADGRTPVAAEITRTSPFRVSPLIATHPSGIVQDFGTMARHDGNPVPYEHEFYRAILVGSWSIDLGAIGVFSTAQRAGHRNLDSVRIELAQERHLAFDPKTGTYRMPQDVRERRVRALLDAMGRMDGGAKQAQHYTDTAPVLVVGGVLAGGNNPFQYVLTRHRNGRLSVNAAGLRDILDSWGDLMRSPIFIGWAEGWQPELRADMLSALEALPKDSWTWGSPRRVLQAMGEFLSEREDLW